MTPEHRTEVQQHASGKWASSTTAFINRAIDETMERDSKKTEKTADQAHTLSAVFLWFDLFQKVL